jgi:pimeloyl-ACP methyl ester carboxylesterase
MARPRPDPFTDSTCPSQSRAQRMDTAVRDSERPKTATNLPIPEPPGDFVQVGQRRMHLYRTGHGDSTVLLEAGLGDWSLHLRPLHVDLARTSRVISYDRAGYGWSDPARAPRTGMRIVADLENLLQAAGESGPYVLAGHSLGGLTMMLFAEAHPDDVAGIVLIDSSHPGQQEAFADVPAMAAQQAADLAEIKALATCAEAGLLDATEVLPQAPDFLSPELQQQWAELTTRTPSLRTLLLELDAWSRTTARVGGPGSLGDTPLTVLASGLGIAAEASLLSQHPDDAQRVDALWRSFQRDHLRRSTRSQLVVAENSGHYIYASEPALVIDAIRAQLPTS